jgi:hypothetical protein
VESNRLELFSSLSPSDCAAQLSNAVDRERPFPFSFAGSHAVAGSVDGPSFRIRKRINYRNSFRMLLTGSMQPHGTGTVIQGEFAMPRFTRAFLPIWFVGVTVLGAIGFEIALITLFSGTSAEHHNAWVGLIVPSLMFFIGIAIVRMGKESARDEERFLTEFLREVLQANEGAQPVAQK